MILFMGKKEDYDFISNLGGNLSDSIPVDSAKKLILTEYSKNAVEAVNIAKKKAIPVLGIVDGYKTVVEAFGGKCCDLSVDCENKQEWAVIDATSPIYFMLESVIKVCRAKPFAIDEKTCPMDLDVMSRAESGEIIAIRNKVDSKKYGNIYAVNFYLQSDLTPDGRKIIRNFLENV
ncbi:MAG: hypothetical protein N2171_08115 [Clostridia bacterium]|nr:hypothetical protein [Clostridia bacterium]